MKRIHLILVSLFIVGQSFAQTALNFDGINDYVDCGNNPVTDITGSAITLEAWVYPTSFQLNIWQGNVINKNDVSQTGYMLRVGGSGQVNFNFGSFGAWNELNSPVGVLTLNTWHHIAGTYDGTTSRIYVDGVEVATANYSTLIASASQPLYLGEDPEYNGRYFPGSMDEVRIWNTTLTGPEIVASMNDELCTTDPNLVAYYRFNEGTAGGNNLGQNTIVDESGNGVNGTLNNFANSGTSSNWVTGKVLGPGMTNTTTSVEACETYTWATNGQTYTNSGLYSETVTGSTGCDSTITLDLNIISPNDLTSNQTACDSYTWSVNGQTYTSSTTVTEALTTSQGCPYNHTLNLTINNSFDTVVLVYDECPPYVWGVNGVSYDTSGTYFAQYTNGQGCDSNYQLNLVIYDDAVADITQNGDGSLSTSWTFDVQWVDCSTNTPIAGETGMNFMPPADGEYAVIAYGSNWCPDTSACYTVDYLGLNYSGPYTIPNFIEPNPTNGAITVTILEKWEFAQIEIVTMDGKVIQSKRVADGTSTEMTIEGSAGMYLVRATNDQGFVYSRPVIKM
ncbi:MAG: hypothetical protein Crog4KO_21530 [Crocinitomicaceae bacterium]